MKNQKRADALWKMLELCDDLQRIRRKMADPDLRREMRTRLRRESQRKTDRLACDLSAYRFRGPVGRLLRECKLGSAHFQVLAVLLHSYLRSEDPACEGRVLLASVFDTSVEVLTGTELLHQTSPLRTGGLIVVEDDEGEAIDVLDARFRLSDVAVQAFREEVSGGVPEDLRRGRGPYGSNRELLVDLRLIHNLYQLRSERVFHQDRWDRVRNTSWCPGQSLTRRIEAVWSRLRDRLEQTPDASQFPAVRFISEHDLMEEEIVIVVHLLFKELYEGNAYADAAELLRLVSRDEADLIRQRRLFLPSGKLLTEEIVQLEAMIENRELTSEVHLSDWAVNYLFGSSAQDPTINSDERLDWHLYLKNLEDTGTFFRDLEAN